MTIYISGPITGTPTFKTRFGNAAETLERAGHKVINPASLPDYAPKQPWCHGKCENYTTWKTADDEWRRINNQSDQTGYFVDRHYKIDRNFRRKHQK